MRKDFIQITDKAKSQIKFLLAQRGKESLGIRVGVKKGGCSGLAYVIEYADEDIQKFEESIELDDTGKKVIIDPKAVMYLLGTIMDYKKEKLAEGFVFSNPNEKGRCGCGESFHV